VKLLTKVVELLWIGVTSVTLLVEPVILLLVLELTMEVLGTVVPSEADTTLLLVLRLVESSVDESIELIVEEGILAFDTGEITDSIVVELVNVLFACVCARTVNSDEDNESIARRLMAMTTPMLIFLPKPGTFA